MGVGSLITHGPKVGFINYDSVEDFNFYIYEMCTTLPHLLCTKSLTSK